MSRKRQLEQQCSELGLPIEGTIVEMESRVATRNLSGSASWGLKMAHELGSPMLCKAVALDELDDVWHDHNWGIQRKIDGCRLIMTHDGRKYGFFSRKRDKQTGLPFDYSAHIIPPTFEDFGSIEAMAFNLEGPWPPFMFDCELTANDFGRPGDRYKSECVATAALMRSRPPLAHERQRSCPATLHVFDCLFWGDKWLLDKPLRERMEHVLELKSLYEFKLDRCPGEIRLKFEKLQQRDKVQFYKSVISGGGEGVVFKHIDDVYMPGKRHWLKLKRNVNQTIGDTVDGWITGFVKSTAGVKHDDLLAGFNVSVIVDGAPCEVASISNLSLSVRRDITKNPELFIGKVVEFDALSVGPNRRFRHAVFKQFRDDKNEGDCREWTTEELDALII